MIAGMVTTPPFQTSLEMERLVELTNLAPVKKRLHPPLTMAVFVVRFLAIHLFQAVSGRFRMETSGCQATLNKGQ
jgi:hypothetical protein